MSLQRTVSGQDNGLCGVHGISTPGVLLSFSWRPKQSIFKPARRNSRIDVVIIGLNSSLSTRTRTTFSVDNISWDCSSSLISISSWRALSIKNKKQTSLLSQNKFLSSASKFELTLFFVLKFPDGLNRTELATCTLIYCYLFESRQLIRDIAWQREDGNNKGGLLGVDFFG